MLHEVARGFKQIRKRAIGSMQSREQMVIKKSSTDEVEISLAESVGIVGVQRPKAEIKCLKEKIKETRIKETSMFFLC